MINENIESYNCSNSSFYLLSMMINLGQFSIDSIQTTLTNQELNPVSMS